MNKSPSYKRSGVSAVNTDMQAYAAAKQRIQKENEYQNLIHTVERLESCVENLKLRVQEIENNGDN